MLNIKSFLDPKEAYFCSHFKEGVFAEIALNNNDVMLVSVLYRSDKGHHSGPENNEGLNDLLTEIKSKSYSNVLCMGDYNFPIIDWNTWTAPGDSSRETKFLNCLDDNMFLQHVDKPTRIRGTDKPSLLDLIITNDGIEFTNTRLILNLLNKLRSETGDGRKIGKMILDRVVSMVDLQNFLVHDFDDVFDDYSLIKGKVTKLT